MCHTFRLGISDIKKYKKTFNRVIFKINSLSFPFLNSAYASVWKVNQRYHTITEGISTLSRQTSAHKLPVIPLCCIKTDTWFIMFT